MKSKGGNEHLALSASRPGPLRGGRSVGKRVLGMRFSPPRPRRGSRDPAPFFVFGGAHLQWWKGPRGH